MDKSYIKTHINNERAYTRLIKTAEREGKGAIQTIRERESQYNRIFNGQRSWRRRLSLHLHHDPTSQQVHPQSLLSLAATREVSEADLGHFVLWRHQKVRAAFRHLELGSELAGSRLARLANRQTKRFRDASVFNKLKNI